MALGVFFLLVGILASEVALFGFEVAAAVAAGMLGVAALLFSRLAWRSRSAQAPAVAHSVDRQVRVPDRSRARVPAATH